MKKIYYLVMSIGTSLVVTNIDAMMLKTVRRIRPEYVTSRKSYVDINQSLDNLLQQRNNTDYAIAMFKKVQTSTKNKKGDIYPLDNWNWYLTLKGMDGDALALHSFSRRNMILSEQEKAKKSIDDRIKWLVNPFGIAERNEQVDATLQECTIIREEYLENEIINSIKSAKTLGDMFTNAVLYKTLYPKKSLLKEYIYFENKNVALDNKLSCLSKEIEEIAILENRS